MIELTRRKRSERSGRVICSAASRIKRVRPSRDPQALQVFHEISRAEEHPPPTLHESKRVLVYFQATRSGAGN